MQRRHEVQTVASQQEHTGARNHGDRVRSVSMSKLRAGERRPRDQAASMMMGNWIASIAEVSKNLSQSEGFGTQSDNLAS
jgi:hypothetical protein